MSDQESTTSLPPEFTAPADTLQPGPHDSDVYMESTGYSAEDDEVSCWIGRNVAGATIGLIQLRAILPLIPGNMGNATTFDFPLLYREMLPPDPYKIMATDPDAETEFVDEAVKAAKWLELQGVRGEVVARTGHGNLQATDVSGQVALETRSGALSVQGSRGTLSVAAPNGAVTIEAADGDVTASSNFGAVLVQGRFASLRATTEAGEVHEVGLPGPRAPARWPWLVTGILIGAGALELLHAVYG